MKKILIIALLLSGCAGDETKTETNVLCSTNITQYTKAQETPLEPLADNQEVVSIEEIPTPEGVEELVTVETNEFAATVEQCNNNGGVSDNETTVIGGEK